MMIKLLIILLCSGSIYSGVLDLLPLEQFIAGWTLDLQHEPPPPQLSWLPQNDQLANSLTYHQSHSLAGQTLDRVLTAQYVNQDDRCRGFLILLQTADEAEHIVSQFSKTADFLVIQQKGKYRIGVLHAPPSIAYSFF